MRPYRETQTSETLRFRWISVQCFEIRLPGGKVLVTDPFYWDLSHFDGLTELTPDQQKEKESFSQSGFSVDDFTGADYILINHVHGDHCNLVGQLWEKFRGRVLVSADCAMELARVFDIPYTAICPLYPNNTYHFDDFSLKVFPGTHDVSGFPQGYFLRPSEPGVQYRSSEGFDIPCPCDLGPLGSAFNLNYIIETKNNFRIDFNAGRDVESHLRYINGTSPNLYLRQRIRAYAPEQMADLIEKVGAQLMIPMHHVPSAEGPNGMNAYIEAVNRSLEERGSTSRAFSPEPYRWYSLGLAVSAL